MRNNAKPFNRAKNLFMKIEMTFELIFMHNILKTLAGNGKSHMRSIHIFIRTSNVEIQVKQSKNAPSKINLNHIFAGSSVFPTSFRP